MAKQTRNLGLLHGDGGPSASEVRARIEGRVSAAVRELSDVLSDIGTLAEMAARPPAAGGVPRKLFTAAETSEMLAIGESTVWALKAKGELIGVNIGAAVRFEIEEIDDFVARHRNRKGA
jgi:predicted DNA-binding transcriptional regulator AlpA